MLKRGGNAVDAAVATGFAMAVTYPRAGNIGGGGFMVIHLGGRAMRTSRSIIARPRRPRPRAIFSSDPTASPITTKSRDSALGIGVPGTVAGLALALEKYGSGKFTLARIVAAGDRARARRHRRRRRYRRHAAGQARERLARWPASLKIFSRADGTPLREGDRLIQTDLAATLTAIAEQGPRGFYEGRSPKSW